MPVARHSSGGRSYFQCGPTGKKYYTDVHGVEGARSKAAAQCQAIGMSKHGIMKDAGREVNGVTDIMPWHKTQLINPEYTRVDLVKEGANSQAHIKLFKSKGGDQTMDLQEILSQLKPEHAEVIEKALKEGKEKEDAATKAKAMAEEEVAKYKEQVEGATVATSTEEDILKTVKDPAVKALLETQIAKVKAAEDVAKRLKDDQDNKEAIIKAKEVPGIGAEEEKLIEVYKRLKNFNEGLCNDVFGIFKTASALINEGGVFTPVGKSASNSDVAGDENAAWGKIEQAAEEIAKGSNLSKAAAITKAIKDNPDLYNQYLKAQIGN